MRLKYILVGAVFCSLFLMKVSGQPSAAWQPTTGPEGGTVNALLINNDKVYAGCGDFSIGAVYQSQNWGESWDLSIHGLPINIEMTALVSMNDTLFVGTQHRGIFRSTDAGQTWLEVNNGLSGFSYVRCLGVHKGVIFAGLITAGLFKSVNAGGQWISANNGLMNNHVRAIAAGDSFLYVGTNGDGVFRSNDLGENWTAVNNGLVGDNRYVFAILATSDAIFIGTLNSVFRSTNQGQSWTQITNGLPAGSAHAFAKSGGKVYAGMQYEGVYVSEDDGDSWSLLYDQFPSNITSLAAVGDTMFTGLNTYGVYKSFDGGMTWQEANRGLANTSVYAVNGNSNNLFAGTLHADFGYVWRSPDSGENWFKAHQGLSTIGIHDLQAMGDTLFAATDGSGVYRSFDNGGSWNQVQNGLSAFYIQALAATSSFIFAGSVGFSQGIFRSSDFGDTWEAANTGLIPSNIVDMVANDSLVFASIGGVGIYRSRNNGTNWFTVNNGISSTNIAALAINGANLYAGGGNSIYKSEDWGDSWTMLPDPAALSGGILHILETEYGLIAATRDSGLFISRNDGNSWENYGDGMPAGFQPLSLYAKDTLLFAGSVGLGVWKRSLNDVVFLRHDSDQNLKPENVSLFQNYPNPFNGTTAIRYRLSQSGKVTLEVFDVLGRKIKTLVSGYQSSGEKIFHWNGTDDSGLPLSSGIYTYCLRVGNKVESRKLLLMK